MKTSHVNQQSPWFYRKVGIQMLQMGRLIRFIPFDRTNVTIKKMIITFQYSCNLSENIFNLNSAISTILGTLSITFPCYSVPLLLERKMTVLRCNWGLGNTNLN